MDRTEEAQRQMVVPMSLAQTRTMDCQHTSLLADDTIVRGVIMTFASSVTLLYMIAYTSALDADDSSFALFSIVS